MNRRQKAHKMKDWAAQRFPLIPFALHTIRQRRLDRHGAAVYAQQTRQSVAEALTPPKPSRRAEHFSGCLIEINNSCNLNCAMCNTLDAKREKKNMSPDVFQKLVRKLKDEGVSVVTLHTVGEPLMHPRLPELIAIAKQLDMHVMLSTNANLTARLKRAYESAPDWLRSIRFSVDSCMPDSYAELRRGGTLDNVLESCEYVHSVNKGRRGSRIALSLHSVICQENSNQIASYFKIFQKYAYPKDIYFSLMTSLSPDTSFYSKNKLAFRNMYTSSVPCTLIFNGMFFNNMGQATLCCRDYENELVIGDALSTPLRELWVSPEAEAIRGQHLGESPLTIDLCKHCFKPKPGVNKALNAFLHYLWTTHPEESDAFWERKMLEFLHDLDDAFTKDGSSSTSFLDKHLAV